MTGKKTNKERETESLRGKRRFLERLQQEQEAKEEQKEALKELVRDAENLGLYDERKL